jgi:glycosyltransferase involved in cell wall biosynthesis/2-polyprenyl-3-methyl-5-hydroxy-6-metoxy-1,4-benzoquinol methylase
VRLNINIHALGIPFNGETLRTQSLGGSESAAYYLARELARMGHRVTVWTNAEQGGVSDGVTYVWAGACTQQQPLGEQFEFYASNTPHDVLILQRHPLGFHKKFAAKLCIWQTHDLALHRSAAPVVAGSWQMDIVTCVSEFHKKQTLEIYGLKPDIIKVVPNGVDPALYDHYPDHTQVIIRRDDDPEAKLGPDSTGTVTIRDKALNLLFQSRPERGLGNALDVMDALAKEGVDAHLYFCAYQGAAPHMRPMYESLWARADAMRNVTNLGTLTKGQLAQVQMSMDLLFYPTEFEEVSCITAMEAMHAGLPMLSSACGALPETCGGGSILIPLKDDKADLGKFAELLSMYATDRTLLTFLKEQQSKRADVFTWEVAAEQLEGAIIDAFSTPATAGAVLRHCIEHSDIGFAKWYLERNACDDAISAGAKAEIEKLYRFSESAEEYDAHYAKHQGIYYDNHNPVGEDVTGTMRFKGTLQLLAQVANERPGEELRVLDYGCAHGHYLVPLAKIFPQFQFLGIDISERAVEAATQWIEGDGVPNATVVHGTQKDLGDFEDGSFDIVLAGEVVEHVWDYRALLTEFVRLLGDEGSLVTTTPFGRWEWLGHEAFREAREHLHHFEREDIYDLWCPLPRDEVDIVVAPAGHDDVRSPLGSYVVRVKPRGCEVGTVDYERKLMFLRPRQTVSACLIVRDGEKTLRRTLDSLAQWVDEVVIGIDPATKDRTPRIIDDFREDWRWLPVTMFELSTNVLDIGFGPARNETLDRAAGEWILWCDADEEAQNLNNLWCMLKLGGSDAYGTPQVHYSATPAQVLTTDYPCRVFRNNGKTRFHGLVHEHPEAEQGKAIPFTLLRGDVQFLHSGYVDEKARRARFRRNLGLLHRDVKENPKRTINKFLMIRDLAQGIQFELEQTQGQPLADHRDRAMRAVELFSELIDEPMLRMTIDSLQYYSFCVNTLNTGFEAKLKYATRFDGAPSLSVETDIDGRFFNREHFERLLRRLNEESLKHYGSRYL